MKKSSTYFKAIGFDYGGVLTGLSSSEYISRISKLLKVKPIEYVEIYYKYNQKANSGEITWHQLWIYVLRELGKSDKYDELMNIFKNSNFGEINTKVLDLIEALRKKGYKTGLLSNNDNETAKTIRSSGLEKYFDVIEISSETGLVKPNPVAIEHFAQNLGVNVNDIIFIDDSEKSLSSSDEVGYMPILYSNLNNLKISLKKLNVI